LKIAVVFTSIQTKQSANVFGKQSIDGVYATTVSQARYVAQWWVSKLR